MPARIRRATQRDVAREAKVSIATVSKALSGGKGTIRISEPTRQRVMETARRLKYALNTSARALRRRSPGALGLFFPAGLMPTASHVYSELTRHVSQAVESEGRGLAIMIHSPAGRGARGGERIRLPAPLADRGVDAVICVHQAPAALLEELDRLALPYVLLNCQVSAAWNAVDCDDVAGMNEALGHLFRLGHRRIGYLGRSVGHPSYRVRREAYEAFLRGHALPPYPDLSREVGPGPDDPGDFGEWALREILSLPQRPTALAAYNDLSALALVHALRDRGVRMPGEISLIGWDDVPEAVVARPRLTTLRHPSEAMARAAVRMVLERMRTGGARRPSITIPCRLVERDSCGPPPGSAGNF